MRMSEIAAFSPFASSQGTSLCGRTRSCRKQSLRRKGWPLNVRFTRNSPFGLAPLPSFGDPTHPTTRRPRVAPECPASGARTPASAPECPALRRSRPGPDPTPGSPPRSADVRRVVRSVVGSEHEGHISMSFIIFRSTNAPFLHPMLGKLRKDHNFRRQEKVQTEKRLRRSAFRPTNHTTDSADHRDTLPGRPRAQIAISAVRFGAGSDFGFHNPSRFFDLPSSRSESRRRKFGMGSVSVGDRSGHRKKGCASSAFRRENSQLVFLIIPWSQVRVLAGPPSSIKFMSLCH